MFVPEPCRESTCEFNIQDFNVQGSANGDVAGKDDATGYGLVNAAAALRPGFLPERFQIVVDYAARRLLELWRSMRTRNE